MTSAPAASSTRIRVLIAEDQELVRRGTSLLLAMEPDMEVVGEAADGQQAVDLALSLCPDIVLMDLHMPGKGGVAATREISTARPATQVLVLTTLSDDETVFAAVRAGAHGYLLKDVSEQELLDTIRALRRGESRLTPSIARKVMDQFRRLAVSGQPPLPVRREAELDALNDKEERILLLITEGMSNRQIGQTLNLAEGTIKNYISRIMDKLHANTRTELAVLTARRQRPDGGQS